MCIPKLQQKIEGTHGDENISDRNKWLHVITFTNISNSAEGPLKIFCFIWYFIYQAKYIKIFDSAFESEIISWKRLIVANAILRLEKS